MRGLYEELSFILSYLNQCLVFGVLFPALVFLGIYLTFSLRFLQVRKLVMSFKQLVRKDNTGEGSLTRYQTVASVLAGNFGTGNISGMAVALTTGGPGALVWMWVMAFFGSIIQYGSCLLAVKYREKRGKEYVGGPMYYLKNGLNKPFLAALFAGSVILGAIGVGIFVQVNSMTQAISFSPAGCGVLIALLVALVMLGGMTRMAKVCSMVIPFMALLYLGSALFILGTHAAALPHAFVTMFKCALGGKAALGGVLGFGLMHVISTGLGRALFATDVGTGYVPILQASAKTEHHVIDGVVALIAPFLVMIVCTITALVMMVTGIFPGSSFQSTSMVVAAFQQGVGDLFGSFVVNAALMLFGYTTILAWGMCFERAISYLLRGVPLLPFRLFFIALIPLGGLMQVNFVWLIADCALSAMTLINLIGITGLAKEIVFESRAYFSKQKIS